MNVDVDVRALVARDRDAWEPLWDGYNAFYGRTGPAALPRQVTDATWRRLQAPDVPVYGLAAFAGARAVGFAHFLTHLSTIRVEPTCHLQDLYVAPEWRGRGVARGLIERVCAGARALGCRRVYWQTHASNAVARALYDSVATHAGFIVYARDL